MRRIALVNVKHLQCRQMRMVGGPRQAQDSESGEDGEALAEQSQSEGTEQPDPEIWDEEEALADQDPKFGKEISQGNPPSENAQMG